MNLYFYSLSNCLTFKILAMPLLMQVSLTKFDRNKNDFFFISVQGLCTYFIYPSSTSHDQHLHYYVATLLTDYNGFHSNIDNIYIFTQLLRTVKERNYQGHQEKVSKGTSLHYGESQTGLRGKHFVFTVTIQIDSEHGYKHSGYSLDLVDFGQSEQCIALNFSEEALCDDQM